MGLLELILIAVGLSMDAFAVSVTLGLSVNKPKVYQYLIPGIYFGLFQAIMPIIGYFAGTYFVDNIQNIDHWVAFVLLNLIGGKMIFESFSKDNGNIKDKPYNIANMLLLAIATSVDALAVGVTFAFFEINIIFAALLIGLTTLSISIIGVKIGNVFGTRFKSKAEFAGGAILIALGFKIIIEHLFFA